MSKGLYDCIKNIEIRRNCLQGLPNDSPSSQNNSPDAKSLSDKATSRVKSFFRLKRSKQMIEKKVLQFYNLIFHSWNSMYFKLVEIA